MALSGLHIVFSYAGGPGDDRSPSALLTGIVGSATITTGQTSTAAPNTDADLGKVVAHLIASEAGYFAVGLVPNATVNPRGYLPADETLDIFIGSGHKISWLTA